MRWQWQCQCGFNLYQFTHDQCSFLQKWLLILPGVSVLMFGLELDTTTCSCLQSPQVHRVWTFDWRHWSDWLTMVQGDFFSENLDPISHTYNLYGYCWVSTSILLGGKSVKLVVLGFVPPAGDCPAPKLPPSHVVTLRIWDTLMTSPPGPVIPCGTWSPLLCCKPCGTQPDYELSWDLYTEHTNL
jgi:hypothetical protein